MVYKEPDKQTFCQFLYNHETKAFCGRTLSSWALILGFFAVYYACVAGFFAGMLSVFLYGFTDNIAPVLTGEYSVLTPNPGMGFRPQPEHDKTLIKFKVGVEKTYKPTYVKAMKDFLKNPVKREISTVNYLQGQGEKTHRNCAAKPPTEQITIKSLPCKFRADDVALIKERCINAEYGYTDGTPCVALKLNKIFEWVPKVAANDSANGEFLEIECFGEHPADKDNIGDIQMYPPGNSANTGKIELYYFPYVGQPNYVSPLVFVKFMRPQKGVLIQVTCQPRNGGVAKNKYHRGDGRVNFELLID